MTEVDANNLIDYVGKKFIYEGTFLDHPVRAEGLLVSVETYSSDLGYGDHIVTYLDLNGELIDFFVFGPEKFQILN